MQQATLAGIRGAGAARSRLRTETVREYRGTFAFARMDEAAFLELLAARKEVEFEGMIDGERKSLKVMLTDVSLVTGMAYFQGLGEPY